MTRSMSEGEPRREQGPWTYRGAATVRRLMGGAVGVRVADWPQLARALEQPAAALTVEITARPRTVDDARAEEGSRPMTPEEFEEHFGHLPVSPND